jgi:hypothetical protein
LGYSAATCKGARDTRSSGEFSKLPEVKECARARHFTIHHIGAHLGAVSRFTAGKKS